MPRRRSSPLMLALTTLCLGACSAPEVFPERTGAPALKEAPPARTVRTVAPDEAQEAARGATALLTREDFGPASRDPFARPAAPAVEPPQLSGGGERPVHVAGVALDDLSLIAVVRGRGDTPGHALFVAPDRRSHSVELGQLFSREAVRLASLDSGTVVIEGVDAEGQRFDREIPLRR